METQTNRERPLPGACMKSPWDWKPRGQCGKMISDLVPHIGACADDLAFIHSMVAKSNVHGPATFMQATGFVQPGFPGMGAWISYGLGRLTDNLPTFVVLPDSRGFAPNGPANWGSAFLPASAQGTMVRANDRNPIFDLFPGPNDYITGASERDGLALLQQIGLDACLIGPPETSGRTWTYTTDPKPAVLPRGPREHPAPARQRWCPGRTPAHARRS